MCVCFIVLLYFVLFAFSVFLANRTNGRAIGTVLRLSSVCRRLWRDVLWLNGTS